MPHPASRVLAMLELLQTHRRITGGDLAARLAVDERTVRRYAGTLAELGIPVTAERGRYGGYRLLPGFKLPPLMLTDDEAVAVVLGLVAADRIGLAADSPAGASAEAKITRVLPVALAERLAALRASLGLTIRGPAPRDEETPDLTELLLVLGSATRGAERLELTYRSGKTPGAAPGRRRVDPYGLVFHSGRWYLVAHDHRTDEIRSFRLDRMVSVRLTGDSFEAPPNFDAVAHVTRQWAGLPWKWEVEVLIEADVAQVRRRIPANIADVTEAPEGVRLSCRAQSLPGMAQMLAGLGWPFTVVRPDELRVALAEHAANLTGYASR
ncbi:helix-turn-helix transcriptional regulator [Actinoplanes friuliensis]|uniref:Helix-turn-helix type 11 domain-containing protein n=1 Tax=Actinoplanes friuliensis DSM 7358 TaxID=1246995 RepID=U5W5H2_9ACTN|nr:YafY family protein [Actinoplanes friuliensis]AGZ44394.1 helix-turn-helix type 11 domain-containing protein [Actinoplanes friuliensis DSM 7358]